MTSARARRREARCRRSSSAPSIRSACGSRQGSGTRTATSARPTRSWRTARPSRTTRRSRAGSPSTTRGYRMRGLPACAGGEEDGVKVAILCGGQGTRLREETEFRPKPMVEIGGRPILWHIMKMYAHAGHRDFVLCLGYRGNMIKEYFLNYEAMNSDFTIALGRDSRIAYNNEHGEQNFKVTLADTGQSTMTGGRVHRIKRYIDDDNFLLTYGDGLSDIDLDRLIKFHKSHGKIATVSAVVPSSRFGIVDTSEDGRVLKFVEKPRSESRVSAGFFVFRPDIFKYLGGEDCILESEPLENLTPVCHLMAYETQ